MISDKDKCACCNFPIEGEIFPLCVPIFELNQLGASFPLYFSFLRHGLLVVFTLFFIAGLGCLIGNIEVGRHEQWKESNTVVELTPGNYGNPHLSDFERSVLGYGDWEPVPTWQSLLHLIAGLVLMLIYTHIDRKTREKAVELDIDRVTPSDFTICVKGLPDNYKKDELAEHFTTHGNDEETKLEIVNITMTYDIKEFTLLSKELVQ